MISSPIGLGHARRDVAICQELRLLHPDLEIEWLAQDPVTRVLEHAGETVHPASVLMANESARAYQPHVIIMGVLRTNGRLKVSRPTGHAALPAGARPGSLTPSSVRIATLAGLKPPREVLDRRVVGRAQAVG